jgi:hypothetical protein
LGVHPVQGQRLAHFGVAETLRPDSALHHVRALLERGHARPGEADYERDVRGARRAQRHDPPALAHSTQAHLRGGDVGPGAEQVDAGQRIAREVIETGHLPVPAGITDAVFPLAASKWMWPASTATFSSGCPTVIRDTKSIVPAATRVSAAM